LQPGAPGIAGSRSRRTTPQPARIPPAGFCVSAIRSQSLAQGPHRLGCLKRR